MATLPHSLVSLPRSSSTDLLKSSSSYGLIGVPLQTLGMRRLGNVNKRDFSVAVIKRKGKVKKYDHPWPKDADPNIKGGILRHLSEFKPLKEKPKPVTLEFERPLIDLEKKIIDVQKMAQETGLDFSDQIISLQKKYDQALRDLYTHLTPIQRVYIARHPNRPTFLDHVFNITEKFVELHGDRAGYDDPAIVTGLGTIDGRSYMFIGQQKGRNTKEHVKRNFGMPTPHGYRKALRMMNYADHHGFPIITFVDTPGAFADLKSEELGQGEAIAYNLRHMFGLKVPVVSVVIGEGGSGGALAIACANKLLMLENAVFYVASPEACAAILWKSSKAAPKAAEKLKITATELCKLQIADGVIPEPLGGAHADPTWTSQQIKLAVTEAMDELLKMDTQELLAHRYNKFRKLSGVREGIPADPAKKVNMKPRDRPLITKTKNVDIKVVKKAPPKPKKISLSAMINRLKKETSQEFAEAVKAVGISQKLETLREEVSKASSSAFTDPAVKEKIENLKHEIDQDISKAPNYSSLNKKLAKLKELTQKKGTTAVEQAVSERIKDVMNRSDLKEEILEEIQNAINSSDLKDKIELLKLEEAREGELPDEELKSKIETLKQQIRQSLPDVLGSSALLEKFEKVKMEIEERLISPGGSNGSLKSEPSLTSEPIVNIEAHTDHDASPVEINVGAN